MPKPKPKLDPRIRQILKSSSLALRKDYGSLDACEMITRACKTVIGDACQMNRDDRYLSIDTIYDLEQATGDCPVTRAMARLHGYELVPVAQKGTPAEIDALAMSARASAASGEIAGSTLEALADGTLDDDELADLLRDNENLEDEARRNSEALRLEQLRRQPRLVTDTGDAA